MAFLLYRKSDPTLTRPSAALYVAFFMLSFITINTYYLVFFEIHTRYILWTFLALGYLISIYANVHYRPHLDVIINLLALVFFAIYFRYMMDNITNFGSILGQLLAVLLVLRSYILFNRDDFFVPLVVSLTIMLLCSIPSYESNYVLSFQAYFIAIIASLYLLSRDKESDTARIGYFEQEKLRKILPPRVEVKMLIGFTTIALLCATVTYLIIPHGEGRQRRYTQALDDFFGKRDYRNPHQSDETSSSDANNPDRDSTTTYVGFDPDSFKIAQGKAIRQGATANLPVMEVQMDYPRYMRAMVWDIYDEGEWYRSGKLTTGIPLFAEWEPLYSAERNDYEFELDKPRIITVDRLRDNRVEYDGQVFMMKSNIMSPFLFLPWETTSLKINTDDLTTNDAREVMLDTPTRLRKIRSYKFTSSSYLPSGMEATFLRERTRGSFLNRYTQLPQRTLAPINGNSVKTLAEKIVKEANASTDYEKTDAILKYLKKSGHYSLEPPICPDEFDPVSYFILEVSPMRGHCEFFSSSMVVMLRALDIPCRIVTGYTPGSYVFNRNRYVIREKNAHAWVEVFFPEIGWIEFDPTPDNFWGQARDTAGEYLAVASNFLNEIYVYSPEQFYRNKIRPFTRKMVSLYYYNSARLFEGLSAKLNLETLVTQIIVVVIIAAVLALILFLRQLRSRSRIYKRLSQVYYRHIIDLLRRNGIRVSTGDTPTEILHIINREFPNADSAMIDFLTDFWILNFAPSSIHRPAYRRIKTSYRKALTSLRKAI